MELKTISEHRPSNMVIDITEEDAKAILKTNEFVESTKENLVVEKKKNVPNKDWTEKEIDKWVEKNTPDIKYYPTKHTKEYILNKLKKNNFI